MSKLLVVDDGKRERELVLVERLIVGRDPACDLSHDDVLLSRRHAEFVSSDGRVTVRDLGSRNGIFVNGQSAAEQALRPGDIVQIGPLRVRYAAERAPVRLTPEELDASATIVLAPPDARAAPASPVPTGFRPGAAAPDAGDARGSEDETRVMRAPTAVTGAVPRPARTPAPAAPMPATATIAAPVPMSPAPAPVTASLAPMVFTQLAALVGLVFLTATLPLIVWRGDIFGLAAERGAVSFLLWPIAPLLIAMAATYWVGTILHARFRQALAADRTGAAAGRG